MCSWTQSRSNILGRTVCHKNCSFSFSYCTFIHSCCMHGIRLATILIHNLNLRKLHNFLTFDIHRTSYGWKTKYKKMFCLQTNESLSHLHTETQKAAVHFAVCCFTSEQINTHTCCFLVAFSFIKFCISGVLQEWQMIVEWGMHVTNPSETDVSLSLPQVPLASSSWLSCWTVWQFQWMRKGFAAYWCNCIIYSGAKLLRSTVVA